MRLTRRAASVQALGVAGATLSCLLALAGCGGSSTATNAASLDNVKIERAIADSILTEHHAYALVSCPVHVPEQQGRHFKCIAKLTVGSYPVYVTETDGKGQVSYSNKAPLKILDTHTVQRSIAASILTQRGLHARVSCPSNVMQRKGLRFTCTARAAGKSYPFEVTEVDGNGHVRYLGR